MKKQGITVTFSEQAKQITSNGLPGWVNEKIDSLRNNPDQAEAMRFVEAMATNPGGALISNGPNSDGINDVYYKETGLPVTPASKQRFESISKLILAEGTAIYQTELAKGSSAADIFDKLQKNMATQPDDYLKVTNWFRATFATG